MPMIPLIFCNNIITSRCQVIGKERRCRKKKLMKPKPSPAKPTPEMHLPLLPFGPDAPVPATQMGNFPVSAYPGHLFPTRVRFSNTIAMANRTRGAPTTRSEVCDGCGGDGGGGGTAYLTRRFMIFVNLTLNNMLECTAKSFEI